MRRLAWARACRPTSRHRAAARESWRRTRTRIGGGKAVCLWAAARELEHVRTRTGDLDTHTHTHTHTHTQRERERERERDHAVARGRNAAVGFRVLCCMWVSPRSRLVSSQYSVVSLASQTAVRLSGLARGPPNAARARPTSRLPNTIQGTALHVTGAVQGWDACSEDFRQGPLCGRALARPTSAH